MKRVLLIVTAVALAMALSAPAWAAGTNPNAVFTLHAKAHATKNYCTTGSPNSGTPIPCTSYETKWPTASAADVYLVVARGTVGLGIAGASCGVYYNSVVGQGADVYAWYLCADLEFTNGPVGQPEWPASRGGNRITWVSDTNCQRTEAGTEGVHAVAGAFYVYAYGNDKLAITPNNNLVSGPELAVANCAAATDYLPFLRAGFVTFSAGGADLGCNPCTEPDSECDPVPAEPTTWGQIKSKYGSN